MTVCLCLLDAAGQPTGVTFPFDGHACFVFGRDANAHCRITHDPAVSRHHFLLETIPPDVRVKDLGSTNGIHVNGVHFGGKGGRRNADGSATVVALNHGDRIRVGKTQIEVQIRLPATEPATYMDDTAVTVALESPIQTAVVAERPGGEGTGNARAQAAAPEVPDSIGLDLFCDRCEKLISGASAVTVDGKVYCTACRAAEDTGWSRKGFSNAVGARADARTGREIPEIPGYEIGDRLGRGGMGVVHRATRLSDGAGAAVKILLPEAAFRSENIIMFRREIAVSRSLSHENIVAFFDAGQTDGRLFLAMEYMPGGSLARRIAGGGPIPVKAALRWMGQMTDGLAAAHRRNLVHRDLKPGNVLLDGEGDGARVKIADFGLAKSLQAAGLSGFTATGMGAGTATCMPPEQLADFKRATKAADVFSMGATFYEMLAGRSPYNFKPGKEPAATVLAFDLTPLAERCPKLPKDLTALVDRCLRSDPAARFPDAIELRTALP